MYSAQQLAAMQAGVEVGVSLEEIDDLRNLKHNIVKAYRQGKYCDITVKTKDGTEVKAHKVILGTQNKFFMRRLEHDPDTQEVVINDVKGEGIKVVIDFIYNKNVRSGAVTKDNAKDILKAGEVFNIDDVKEEAALCMAKNLNEDNVVDVMTNNLFAGAVSNSGFIYAANNFQILLSSDKLKKRLLTELNVSQICHLLSQKNLMLWDTKTGLYLQGQQREKQLFFFVMAYVVHDKENRLPDLKRILTCLKLPLLVSAKVLSVVVMGQGLKEAPEELAGMLSDILDPFDQLTGSENLATLFANDKSRDKSERRMLVDTCKMRYATIAHTTPISELLPHGQPWADKTMFSPSVGEKKVAHSTSAMIQSITVYTCNKEGNDDMDRKVCGMKITWNNGEGEELGLTDDNSIKQETYNLESGEFITEVRTYHAKQLVKKNFQKEMTSLANINDLSFETSKDRTLGPMKDPAVPLIPGIKLRIPGKVRNLERNCPGKFFWLQGFGTEEVKFNEKDSSKLKFYPIWGFQTHFKVYSLKDQNLEFIAGVKKMNQYSTDGIKEITKVDDIEDFEQIEMSPVHEVVDIGNSDSGSEGSDGETMPGMMMQEDSVMDDSIMVVDSESGDDEADDDEEESDDGRFYRRGNPSIGFPSFKPINGKGGENEPIEIESSSEDEGEKSPQKGKAKTKEKIDTENNMVNNEKEVKDNENGEKSNDATQDEANKDEESETNGELNDKDEKVNKEDSEKSTDGERKSKRSRKEVSGSDKSADVEVKKKKVTAK